MKKYALILALLTPICAHAGFPGQVTVDQTHAPDPSPTAGVYVSVYGGANFTNYGNRHAYLNGAGSTLDITPDNIHSDIGGTAGIKLGYNLPYFADLNFMTVQPAFEIEGLYLGTKSTYTTLGGALNDHTSYNSGAGFLNTIVRFDFKQPIVPYLGIGAGGEYLTSHTDWSGPGVHVTGLGGDTFDFAAQGLAGVDFKLMAHITVFTEYKFINAFDTDLKSSNVGGSSADYHFKPDNLQQQVITAGVKYSF
jgi:opacity protein-like surface antigen